MIRILSVNYYGKDYFKYFHLLQNLCAIRHFIVDMHIVFLRNNSFTNQKILSYFCKMAERNEIKEEIKRVANIVEIVGEYVPLKQRGRNFLGLCPFHEEKTPSFTVFPETNIYKCFGCGKSGDAFSFMMEYHGMGFREAMKTLAARYGIKMIDSGPTQGKSESEKKENIFSALKDAAMLYQNALKHNDGKIARDYFANRGFGNELIEKFMLGYSVDKWEGIVQPLQKAGYDQKTLEDAGLIVVKDDGRFYDRFRGRPIFPIRDYLGRVIGFGARAIKKEDIMGKYINSPQSPVYDKSRSLYGLFEGRQMIMSKKEAILVEGYADVLSLYQAGFENCVASSGTSLTTEQLKLLKRYCSKLYFVYDGDKAGIKAADRGLELALQEGFDVMLALLPEGEDPDSMVRDHGAEAFQKHLDGATGFIEFRIELQKKAGMFDTPGGIADAARELLKLVANIPDKMKHDFFINHFASLLHLNERQIQQLYKEKDTIGKQPQRQLFRKQQEKPVQPERTAKDILRLISSEETLLLHIAMRKENDFNYLIHEKDLREDDLITPDAQRLFGLIIYLHEENSDILAEIISNTNLNETDRDLLTSIALKKDEVSSKWVDFGVEFPEDDIERMVNDAIAKIKMVKIDKEINQLKSSLSGLKDFEEVKANLNRQSELNQEKEKLFLSSDTFTTGKD